MQEYTDMEQDAIRKFGEGFLTDQEIQVLGANLPHLSLEIQQQVRTDAAAAFKLRLAECIDKGWDNEDTLPSDEDAERMSNLFDHLGIQYIGADALIGAAARGKTVADVRAAMGRVVMAYLAGKVDVNWYECDEHGAHAYFELVRNTEDGDK